MRVLLVTALAASAIAGAVQAQSLVGSWQGFAQGIQFNLVVQPNGAYSETQRSGSLMTMQEGVIQQAGPGQIAFVVENWQPQYQPYTGQASTRPPGGVWAVHFNGPNSVTLQDVRLHGVVVFNRVP